MLAAFNDGRTLTDIGKQYGVTRERVRQIVSREGVVPRSVIKSMEMNERAARIKSLAAEGKWAREIAAELQMSESLVNVTARSYGFKVPRKGIGRGKEEMLADIEAKVKAGMSLRQACKCNHTLEGMAGDYLRSIGVKPKRGRWRDFSARHAIIVKMRAQGAGWENICDVLEAVEGYRLTAISVCNYAAKHNLYTRLNRGPRKFSQPREPRAPKVPRPPKQIIPAEIRDTIRATCIANYGKTSAAVVAKELGITRNMVIGHWFRARNKGEISP